MKILNGSSTPSRSRVEGHRMKRHITMGIKKLIVLANKFVQKQAQDENDRNVYGGYEFELPATHTAAMVVKEGGFSCANCKFVNVEEHSCGSPYYQSWNGSDKLPDAPLNSICSDWFEPRE